MSLEDVRRGYNAVADQYNDFYGSSPLHLAESDFIFGRVRRWKGNLLDVGCGPATALRWLAPTVGPERYVGIDIADEAIRVARRDWPGYTFEVADLRTYDPPLRFDGVFGAFSPLNHVDPFEVADAVRHLLVPGGRFMVMGVGEANHVVYVMEATEDAPEIYTVQVSPGTLLEAFGAWFGRDVKVWGVRAPGTIAKHRRLFRARLELESRTVGRWHPERMHHIVVEGRRSSGLVPRALDAR